MVSPPNELYNLIIGMMECETQFYFQTGHQSIESNLITDMNTIVRSHLYGTHKMHNIFCFFEEPISQLTTHKSNQNLHCD